MKIEVVKQILKKHLRLLIAIPSGLLALISWHSLVRGEVAYIKNDCSLGFAQIVDVHDGGVSFDLSLNYQYKVGDQIFEGTVEMAPKDKVKIRRCMEERAKCSDYFVWVIYSNEDHSKSLVNLSRLFTAQDTSNVSVPDSYERFY